METAETVWRRKVVALSPLGLFLIAFITIITSYQATFEHGILDFLGGRVKTPPISLLMFAGPGKRIGQIGFGLVSILGCGCLPTFFSGLESATDQASGTIILLLRGSVLIAFSCLAVVGLLPLQEDIDLVITKKHPISWQSIIHQLAAALFFLFSIMHMGIWLYFTARKCESSNNSFHYKNSSKSFVFKTICFTLCLFPLPTAFLLHPVSPVRKRLSLTQADAGGLTQYALVACVSCFFASYSSELWFMEKQASSSPVKENTKANLKTEWQTTAKSIYESSLLSLYITHEGILV